MSRLFTLLGVIVAPLLLITLIHSPWLTGVATSSLILMIMVVGLHLFSGNSGVLAFGHVAFVAIGAYVCGLLTVPALVKPAIFPNLPYVLAHTTIPSQAGVLVGGVAAAIAAAILFYPLRRLNAQALSIVTLALLLITNIFFSNVRLSSSGGSIFRVPLVASLWTVAPWLLLAVLIAFLFQRSRLGLRLRASREDEFAAESGGIDIGWTRLFAFVVSAAIMGVAGGLYALSIGSFSAADFFIDLTILLFAMMVVGGMRSLSGAVVGAASISLVSNFISMLQNGISFGDFTVRLPSGSANVSIALCMIVVLLFRSEGLMRDLEIDMTDLLVEHQTQVRKGNIMTKEIRRIVTCDDANGKSGILIDGVASRKITVLTEMWVTDGKAANHRDGIDHAEKSDRLEPPTGGTLFRYFEIAPESEIAHLSEEEKRQTNREWFAAMNGAHLQPDTSRHPAMHRSNSTDYIILLSGEITLMLDKEERTLKPFDCVIQRGTNHAWVNRGRETALLMAVLLDDKRDAD